MRLMMNGSQIIDLAHTIGNFQWWKKNSGIVLLVFGLMVSIFMTVIIKTQTRATFIDYQALQYQQSQLQHEQSQLILEKGAFASEMRVMSLAKNKLHMVMPQNKQVVIVNSN